MIEIFKLFNDEDYSFLFAKNIKWSEIKDLPQKNLNSKLRQLLFSKTIKSLEFIEVENTIFQENTINELYMILKKKEFKKLLVISSMNEIISENCYINLQKNKYAIEYKNTSYFVEQNRIISLQYLENLLAISKTLYDIRTVVITDFGFTNQLQSYTSKIIDSLIEFCEIFNLKIIVIIDQNVYKTI